MKQVLFVFLSILNFSLGNAQFGQFASAIKINNNVTNQFYNTTGTGASQINPSGILLQGQNLGSFTYQSGLLKITGGELKTFKTTLDNVCGAKMYYAVYPTATPPTPITYTSINLPFKCNCGAGIFLDGLGPCAANDQKWSTEALNIDLTNTCAGYYTLDIYYDYTGANNSTSACTITNLINNSGARYKATFAIFSNFTATASVSNATLCAGQTIQLNANGILGKAPYTYSWTGPNGYTSSLQNPTITNASVAASGVYTATISDACGSTNIINTASVLVKPASAAPTVTTPINLCNNQTNLATLNATGTNLLWYNTAVGGTGSSSSPTPSTVNIGTTSYYVTQNTNGCESAKTKIDVIVNQLPTADAGVDATIISGDVVVLNGQVTGATSYTWLPINISNTLNPSVTPTTTTVYTLNALNSFGCQATDNVQITVIPYCIKIMNSFTPNGDGINDKWLVTNGQSCTKQISAKVYNRYGGLVYENSNYNNNWDGTYKGNNVSDATYYYILEVTLINNNRIYLKGDVTILR